ncbi:MAG: glycoside hydrolase family 3 N-terminal domain-containing protein, partial [Bacteroidales bacterium]|nr:glycoside hydrolase family 3 N-terminal domain-containing protein [Bacteroidales bacterium]
DPSQPIEVRVQNLLSLMTPEEKFRQMFMIPGEIGTDSSTYYSGLFGFQVGTTAQQSDIANQMMNYNSSSKAYESVVKINEIQKYFIEQSRLGIPMLPFDEALHGLVRPGATAFPQSIGLAATWNPDLVSTVAGAIADECGSRGIKQILSPVVNVCTDVRWGRTEETYGEDPFLVSQMAIAYISAFESRGIITTPKHFAANSGDGGRDSYPIHYNERYMREVILPPFEESIKFAGARSIMTAYNSYDGTPCTANDYLLNEILRKEWGFGGFVISDAGATGGANVLHFTASDYADATVKSINGGLDVIFQTDINHQSLFIPPFLDGRLSNATIDTSVARILRLKFELGLFENPYADPQKAAEINGCDKHKQIAEQAALESIVLLKNENDILPIGKTTKSIAVIGQDAVEARLGGYSGPGNENISILEGIQNFVGQEVDVNYTIGCHRKNIECVTIPTEALSCKVDNKTQNGLRGDYYNNVNLSGVPVFTRCDNQIEFQWTLFSPDPEKLSYDFYSVRWTGKIKSPESGIFKIGIDGNDGYRLYIDEKLIIDNWIKKSKHTIVVDFEFEKNREYDIKIEFYEPVGNAWFNLIWNVGVKNNENLEIEKAVNLAAESEIAIIVVGIEEGEFRDRAYLNLPGKQEELIKAVAATGKPVIVVIVGGSAITMNNWINEVDGIIDVWYPGEQGGNAVAKVLFGEYNPAGRLPITFPVFEGQLPLVYNHKPTGRGDDYDNLTGKPLFPFGFGLSYTSFQYSDIKLEKNQIAPDETTSVSVKVTNIGKLAGDEVVQLYIRDELASIARPVTELKGFKRIHLASNESKIIEFDITPEMLSMYDMDMNKIVEPGSFRILIGGSSMDIRQRIILTVVK